MSRYEILYGHRALWAGRALHSVYGDARIHANRRKRPHTRQTQRNVKTAAGLIARDASVSGAANLWRTKCAHDASEISIAPSSRLDNSVCVHIRQPRRENLRPVYFAGFSLPSTSNEDGTQPSSGRSKTNMMTADANHLRTESDMQRSFAPALELEAGELDALHTGLVRHLATWREAHEAAILRMSAVMARMDAILERFERARAAE